jgi:hypothetical protein
MALSEKHGIEIFYGAILPGSASFADERAFAQQIN